jgi:hypothetical protein
VFKSVDFLPAPALRPRFSAPFSYKLGRYPTEVFAGDIVKIFCNLIRKVFIGISVIERDKQELAPGPLIQRRHEQDHRCTPG